MWKAWPQRRPRAQTVDRLLAAVLLAWALLDVPWRWRPVRCDPARSARRSVQVQQGLHAAVPAGRAVARHRMAAVAAPR